MRSLLALLWLDDGSRMDLLRTSNVSNTRGKPWAGCPVSSVWQFWFWNSACLYYSLYPALENMPNTNTFFYFLTKCQQVCFTFRGRTGQGRRSKRANEGCFLRANRNSSPWWHHQIMSLSNSSALLFFLYTSQGRHLTEQPLLSHNKRQKLKNLNLLKKSASHKTYKY